MKLKDPIRINSRKEKRAFAEKRKFEILSKRKYEILLFSLILHLFIGMFFSHLKFYQTFIWPINMLIVGNASVGVFLGKSNWKIFIKNLLFLLALALPIGLPFLGHLPYYILILNCIYILFFSFIFIEVIKFLIRPSYINADVISASACGYFLLLEINVFLMQLLFYTNPNSFIGVSNKNSSETLIDLVYFCSVTLTSTGFGDITPNSTNTKLITSLFGIIGHFYSVVLVGILISKYSSKPKN